MPDVALANSHAASRPKKLRSLIDPAREFAQRRHKIVTIEWLPYQRILHTGEKHNPYEHTTTIVSPPRISGDTIYLPESARRYPASGSGRNFPSPPLSTLDCRVHEERP